MNRLPEALMERNIFWLFIDAKKIQFPDEVLSNSLESAFFLGSSRRCSQSGLPGPSQDFEVKEQRWQCKIFSLMGIVNPGPQSPQSDSPLWSLLREGLDFRLLGLQCYLWRACCQQYEPRAYRNFDTFKLTYFIFVSTLLFLWDYAKM